MNQQNNGFGSVTEAIIYPLLLVVVMWLVFWADHLFPQIPFYKWGVMPKNLDTLKGIIFMPFLHSYSNMGHIINNSFPTFVLLAALIYYYRPIALRVLVISWILTGLGLWLFAENNNSYHIGMSGVIYALAGFLFTSGVIRKYRPLQAISLFVAFVYGSMVWGIFPMEPHVSWEGHLSGLLSGVSMAFVYRKLGPQAPKYQYEVERELGIEPPDLEGIWKAKMEEAQRRQEELQTGSDYKIVYHYKSSAKPEKEKINPPEDENPST